MEFIIVFVGLYIFYRVIQYLRRQPPGRDGRGWWGGRDKDPTPTTPPSGGGGLDPELLEVPAEWIAAHAVWAKKIVRKTYARTSVLSTPVQAAPGRQGT